MSEYCRQWVADPSSSSHDTGTMTRLPVVHVDDTTAAPPLPAPRTPSPAVHILEDEEDHDDDLSINSSDLDEDGWLNIDASASVAASTTASALGSSTISDLPLSSREPSEASVSESENDADNDEVPAWTSPSKDEKSPDDESVYTDADAETPAASQQPIFEFKSSWIFPDPTSSSASLTTSGTATATDNTPLHSLANIRSMSYRSPESPVDECESATDDVDLPDAPDLKIPTMNITKKAAGNFPVDSPRPERKRWSIVAVVFGLLVLLVRVGPFVDLASIMSQTFGHNTMVTSLLGLSDQQTVKESIAALTTTTTTTPLTATDPAPLGPTDTPDDAHESEYSFVWKKPHRRNKPATDVALAVIPSFPRRRGCHCPPRQCNCPASVLDAVSDALVSAEAYAEWTLDMLAALARDTGDVVRKEAELQWTHHAALLKSIAANNPTVRVVVENAGHAPELMRRAYALARAEGWRSVRQTCRGLDRVLKRSRRFRDRAKRRVDEIVEGAVSGAHSVVERFASEGEDSQEKAGNRGVQKRRCRRKAKGYGKGSDPDQRLKCGFRGYGGGCRKEAKANNKIKGPQDEAPMPGRGIP